MLASSFLSTAGCWRTSAALAARLGRLVQDSEVLGLAVFNAALRCLALAEVEGGPLLEAAVAELVGGAEGLECRSAGAVELRALQCCVRFLSFAHNAGAARVAVGGGEGEAGRLLVRRVALGLVLSLIASLVSAEGVAFHLLSEHVEELVSSRTSPCSVRVVLHPGRDLVPLGLDDVG